MRIKKFLLAVLAVGIIVALIPMSALAGSPPTFGSPPLAPNVAGFTSTTATIAWGGVNATVNLTFITCYWCNVDGGTVPASWGTTDGGGNATITVNPEGQTQPTFNITGLTATTKYYWNMVVTDPNGSTWWTTGTSNSFTTTSVTNSTGISTVSATLPTTNSVNLNGSLTSLGGVSIVYVCFFYGASANFLTSNPSQTLIQYYTAIQPFTISITSGLLPNTTYYFCAASSPDGQNWNYGKTMTFFTGTSSLISTVIQIKNVGLFSGYQQTGDLLVGVEAYCAYSSLYPSTSSQLDFQVQLLGLDDATIIAQTPLLQWGDKPEWIYLNQSAASALVTDGTYYIVITPNFTTNAPSVVSYQVQPADWSKSVSLPNWCLTVANAMNLTDTSIAGIPANSYTTPSTTSPYGSVITTSDDGYFTLGLTSLMSVFPNLFLQGSQTAAVSFTGSNDQYDVGHVWATQVGTQISSDFTVFGNVIGVSGKSAMGYGIALLSMVIVIIGLTMGGKGLVLLVLDYPLLIWGTEMGVISISWLIVPCIAMVILFARQFWVKPT